MEDQLIPAEIAEITRHVLAGECPCYVKIPCNYFEDCFECWWWHLAIEGGENNGP